MGSLRREPADAQPESAAADLRAEVPGMDLMHCFEGVPDAFDIGWSAGGDFMAAAGTQGDVNVWSAAGKGPRHLGHHAVGKAVKALAWHPSKPPLLATGSADGTVFLWDLRADTPIRICALQAEVEGVAWAPDGSRLAVTDREGGVGVWDVSKRSLRGYARVHQGAAYSPGWSPDGQIVVTCGSDGTINVLASDDLQSIHQLVGHTGAVWQISLSPDGSLVASVSEDETVRVWDVGRSAEVVVLEGHTDMPLAVRFSPKGNFLASAADAGWPARDGLRVWRCRDWECLAVLPGEDTTGTGGLAFNPRQPLLAVAGMRYGGIDCYRIDYGLLDGVAAGPGSRRYGNAKVVLLGDTGVGKSGLGLVLSGQTYQPTDSTHGRNVWTLHAEEVEVPGGGKQTREVLLWDLAGQPGYRIIHQLHLNEVAVALIVFDSRSETDPFSGVKYWARALAQARRLEGSIAVPMKAYLVAARADRGGVGVSAQRVRVMVDDLGLDGFFETSAKEGWQVTELTQAIRDGIDWEALPIISSSTLFESIKGFLLAEKQQGRSLCTADDLFHGFRRTQHNIAEDAKIRASFDTCIGRVESRGLIRKLQFGDLVLLQPELLDAYASGMVQAARSEPDGLGFIAEEEALSGRFGLADTERVSDRAQERLLLIATVEELLRHEIALKEITDRGVDLVFPSQFTRERPDAPDIPGKEVTFTFEGPLQNIYATLAVRLSHSRLFGRQAMWQNAASYTATVGGMCGIHLRELEEGRGELVLFYDGQASREVRTQFETYVADHLRLRALPGTLTRRAVRACSRCGYILPEDLVQRRLERGMTIARCPACEDSDISLVQEPVAPADTAVAEMNRSADEQRDRNAAALRLKGKIETSDYDVFLCYNSRDRDHVVAIGERLKERGILPWLDSWEIPPGSRWQRELSKQLKSVKSAAVFIGLKGPGPWQELEVETLLGQIAQRNRPIIPVILEGRAGSPRLPAFLNMWQVVDMRQSDPDPFEQLVWGITGERPPRS
jgi:WD40 repeat protein